MRPAATRRSGSATPSWTPAVRTGDGTEIPGAAAGVLAGGAGGCARRGVRAGAPGPRRPRAYRARNPLHAGGVRSATPGQRTRPAADQPVLRLPRARGHREPGGEFPQRRPGHRDPAGPAAGHGVSRDRRHRPGAGDRPAGRDLLRAAGRAGQRRDRPHHKPIRRIGARLLARHPAHLAVLHGAGLAADLGLPAAVRGPWRLAAPRHPARARPWAWWPRPS